MLNGIMLNVMALSLKENDNEQLKKGFVLVLLKN
jgi:hypothetical protein